MRKICFPYKRMISMLLVLICMLGLLPTAALAADAPGSIKMEDCTHNGVHYESPSLGTCWLHQMTFDYNQKSTIGFCAEHGKGMGWSLEGQTWGNPKPITDPTVQTMMAYYYAHTTGVFTDQAHALGVDEVWGSDYSWTMNAWVQAIIWRYKAGLLADPATACAEELLCVYNNLEHTSYSSIDDLLDGMSFRDRTQYILDLGKQGVWGECTVYEYQYTGSSTSSHQAKDVQAIMIGNLDVTREKYDLTVKKVDATNPNKGLPGARFMVRSENGTYEQEIVTGSDGTYTLKGLDASTYSIVELEAPEGYQIDNAGPQYVALPNGSSRAVTVTFTDTPEVTSEGTIRKVDADDPTTGLAGAVIRIDGVDIDRLERIGLTGIKHRPPVLGHREILHTVHDRTVARADIDDNQPVVFTRGFISFGSTILNGRIFNRSHLIGIGIERPLRRRFQFFGARQFDHLHLGKIHHGKGVFGHLIRLYLVDFGLAYLGKRYGDLEGSPRIVVKPCRAAAAFDTRRLFGSRIVKLE